ncbi:M20/M25/M40 family metallo-hydrolase [Gulosibacter chungangensis]|uniref:M20/M25/M40 family metallo-hydrolase n=1 Tax=Gulosibacter chungangensis TaxID=979746 RepID=A0A7J5BD51_9MICO|nr:M20/M25/M40 family metallo-hydrolase [Gulosibacter chungangensis]KAB1644148.1 M20/M25/M40 family metallo-hydrolase [Gulosibacter chungangensis]
MTSENALLQDPTVVATRDLIRINTTNWGGGKSEGEREAAEYLEARLKGMGLETTVFESEPRRTSVVARVAGRNPDKPALVVHGHTDVVPSNAADWSVDPFRAEVKDGCIWGRGAVDMKNMDAMIVTALEQIQAQGQQPERDLIIAFFADEEDGGKLGAHYAVTEFPELFAGATEAISEVGGYSVAVDGKRAYLLQTGEKGMLWFRLRSKRLAGHGSRFIAREDNAVTALAEALVRLTKHDWSMRLTETTRGTIEALCVLTGEDPTQISPDEIVLRTGSASSWLTASLRTTVNPTMLDAGYKVNVIPAEAMVAIDARPLPGEEGAFLEQVREIVGPDIEVEIDWEFLGTEAPSSGPLVDAALGALDRHDPGAIIIPYLLPAGTDNKSLARLGINGYGFAPLKLPLDLDFPAMFHGVDERVPLESLVFGREVLADFLLSY